MRVESINEYKFVADQKVIVTQGFFKGQVSRIEGFKHYRDQWWNLLLVKKCSYRLYIPSYGYLYFMQEALEAVE